MVRNFPKISISVPVYNAEKYLRQCLESLICQTLKDIEIVVVNDGSTDNSDMIVREYVERDSRVKLICKENGGLASARLVALQASKGKYFCACDADDWVEPDMFEKLYQLAVETDADIVMCDYWSEYPSGKKVEHHYTYDVVTRKDLLDDALNNRFPCMVWNKIFKRELFERYNLSWEQGVNMGEDLLLMLKILNHPVQIVHLPLPLYHYRRVIGGLSYTNNVSLSMYDQLLWIRHWSDDHIDNVKYGNGLFIQWLDQAFAGLRVKEGMTANYYEETTLNNIRYSDFTKYSYPKLKGLIALLTKIFGYNVGKTFVKLMYRFIYH